LERCSFSDFLTTVEDGGMSLFREGPGRRKLSPAWEPVSDYNSANTSNYGLILVLRWVAAKVRGPTLG
tara:strand:- start:326 stop:529 length:204 start_codon:yes stop_codon:yes gene_type:complete